MPNRTIRFLSLLALLLTVSVTAAQEPMVFRDAEQEERFKKLTLELRCAVCQNQNLADSDAPLAQDDGAVTFSPIPRPSGSTRNPIAASGTSTEIS